MKKARILYVLLILIISRGVKQKNKISDRNNIRPKMNHMQSQYKYKRWFMLHSKNGGVIAVNIFQDSLYNLFLEVFDSSKRRIYGSGAIMMSGIDSTGGVIKEYYFNKNQKIPVYVISTYVIGSTYGKTGLFFIWNNGNGWQVRTDGLNRVKIERLNHQDSFKIVDYYPNQQKHIYMFEDGNIVPIDKEKQLN